MTKLADWFVEAGAHYGLPVDVDFALHLSDGRQLNSVIRISGVGGDKGMLIFSDYEAIRADTAELLSMGFGYSVMNEPSLVRRSISHRSKMCSQIGVGKLVTKRAEQSSPV